jgi:hypothetical protein
MNPQRLVALLALGVWFNLGLLLASEPTSSTYRGGY